MAIAFLEDTYPRLKKNKQLEWFSSGLIIAFLICCVSVVVVLLIDTGNQPDAFSKCMSGYQNETDPEALNFMEDYCYESTK